jgi:hypothetical protein
MAPETQRHSSKQDIRSIIASFSLARGATPSRPKTTPYTRSRASSSACLARSLRPMAAAANQYVRNVIASDRRERSSRLREARSPVGQAENPALFVLTSFLVDLARFWRGPTSRPREAQSPWSKGDRFAHARGNSTRVIGRRAVCAAAIPGHAYEHPLFPQSCLQQGHHHLRVCLAPRRAHHLAHEPLQ